MKYCRIIFSTTISLALFFVSCSNQTEKKNLQENEEKASTLNSTSAIIDKACSSDATIAYSYYLPKNYSAGKKYPVLILFDPHGDAHFAIEKYTSAADKFDFILMSTTALKNGMAAEAAGHVMQTILYSAANEMPVNPRRVYVGGFSGGARYAAMLAMSGSGIQGLMVAGAGFPIDTWKNLSPSVVIAAANDGDMNLPEILALDNIQDKEQRSRVLIMRDKGIHEWPSEDKMQEALAIFTAYAIRDSIEDDKSKLDLVLATYDSLNNSNYCAATKIHKALFYERAVKALAYQKPIDKYGIIYSEMIKSSAYLNDLNTEQSLVKEEVAIKNNYYAAMGSKDTIWWHSEMEKLNASILSEKNNLKQAQLMRIRNGLSLMCYMNLDKTMKANSNQDAYYLSVLYRNIDPDNSESWFLAAVMEARNQNVKAVIDFLSKAISKGFKERNRVHQTADFNFMLGDPSFQEVVNKIPN